MGEDLQSAELPAPKDPSVQGKMADGCVGGMKVSFDGDFVVWDGVKLPAADGDDPAMGNGCSLFVPSQLHHALLKLARPTHSRCSYSAQGIVAALNMASASMIRKGDLVMPAQLLKKADELISRAAMEEGSNCGQNDTAAQMQRLKVQTPPRTRPHTFFPHKYTAHKHAHTPTT